MKKHPEKTNYSTYQELNFKSLFRVERHDNPDNPDNQVTHHLGMWDILESYFIQSMGPWAENEGSMHTLRKDCP